MVLNLPDQPKFAEAELRLELASALLNRGKLGKIKAAEFAGVDFFTFQRALAERGVSSYSPEMVEQDIRNQ